MTRQIDVFISSTMQELAAEREALRDLLPTLAKGIVTFHAWVFEADSVASNKSAYDQYVKALAESELYIGLFWNRYGKFTIEEYEHATQLGLERHIYVKDVDTPAREAPLKQFLYDINDPHKGISLKAFQTTDNLCHEVRRAIESWVQDQLVVRRPGSQSATLAKSASQIPDLPAAMIGRQAKLNAIEAKLQGGARLLLNGLSGLGKTTLAAMVASRHITDGKGPVLWLRLGGADAAALFEALGQPFQAAQEILNVPNVDRAIVLRDILDKSNVTLVVLDDAWDGPTLKQLLDAIPRQIPVLVTSQQRFGMPGTVDLDDLTLDEALELLNYYAGDERDFRSDDEAKALCQQLGYHPYALEIAGSRLLADGLTPKLLRTQMANNFDDIRMPLDFAGKDRESMKSLLDTSVRALDGPTRDVFLSLGALFAPEFTAALAVLLTNKTPEQVDAALTNLHRRSLVKREVGEEGVHYRLHNLTYSYVRTIHLSTGKTSNAALDACKAYAEQYKADVRALHAENPNLLGAAQDARRGNNPGMLIDLLMLLAVQARYFESQGYGSLARDLLKSAAEAAETTGRKEDAHYLWGKLGDAYRQYTGQYDLALTAYNESLRLARELNNLNREALLLTMVGATRFSLAEPDADIYYEQAHRLASAHNDERNLAVILQHRSTYEVKKIPPDYAKSREYADESVALASRNDFPGCVFLSLLSRGNAERHLGHVDAAQRTSEQLYELAQTHHNEFWKAHALWAQGEDYQALARDPEAQSKFDDALALLRRLEATGLERELSDYMRQNGYIVRP